MATNFILALVATAITQIRCNIGQNNRVRSPIPPLNMPLQDIPMFLTITFDDALHGPAHEKTALIMNHTNRNNEPIPLIYFISNEFSDYSLIQERYLQGCEMAVHTVTHTTSTQSDLPKWYHEIKTSRELMSTHADIPMDQMTGFRAPFLQISDLSFQILTGLQPKFMYDSSVPMKIDKSNNLFDWPYTFDQYDSEFLYEVGQGPQTSYPGLWEIPMYTLYDDITNSSDNPLASMDYTGDYTLLEIFKDNFLHRMDTNKAPMGLYFHSSWLYTQSHVDAMNDFIEWVLSLDDTWMVTNKDIINWMNNPIPAAQYSYVNNNQLMNGKTVFKTCGYNEGLFHTVQDDCPAIIPHSLRYNSTELINSAITITSTPDNILTTPNDMCINDVYTIYESGNTYCANPPNQDIIKYNDALYQCGWWTQGETPGADDVWQLIKQCTTYTESFAKATVTPYGTMSLFQDQVLDIDITFKSSNYILPQADIAVIVDNNTNIIHNLSIFEDYEFTQDNNTNTAKLTIRFIEITHAQYEITFSFKDVSLPPTNSPTVPTTHPSNAPSFSPTLAPSIAPSSIPSNAPTTPPSNNPSIAPSQPPSFAPSQPPSNAPSNAPSFPPSQYPTFAPVAKPTQSPSNPTIIPTIHPSQSPTDNTKYPTITPSKNPTLNPSLNPSQNPTLNPSQNPTQFPTKSPTINPTYNPTQSPTINPSLNPSQNPTQFPTKSPTLNDLCKYDIYTFYDQNMIYCENNENKTDFVRFNNALYECNRKTQSEAPTSLRGEDVWIIRKQCVLIYESTSVSHEDDVESGSTSGSESVIFGIEMDAPVIVWIIVIGIVFMALILTCLCIVLICIMRKQGSFETRMDTMMSLTDIMGKSGSIQDETLPSPSGGHHLPHHNSISVEVTQSNTTIKQLSV